MLNEPKHKMEIMFLFLKVLSFQHNSNIYNSFMFDGRHEVHKCIYWKVKKLIDATIVNARTCGDCLIMSCVFNFFHDIMECPSTYVARATILQWCFLHSNHLIMWFIKRENIE